MKHPFDQATLDKLLAGALTKKHIYGAVFYVSSADQSIDLISATGDMNTDDRYYIASINKLFVSAIILNMHYENKLLLDDPIARFLPDETIDGLHCYKGKDYSKKITIKHLLNMTSGLPCYLLDRQANGKKAMAELEAGRDQSWPIEKVINEIKHMKPHFPPGQRGKAKYIDSNHQILSLIIEQISAEPIQQVLMHLFQELNLSRTYVCEDVDDQDYVPLRFRDTICHLPLFLTSTRNDIISTARDQMIFLKAIFNGYFFPRERLTELMLWNAVFFPFQYGIGVQKFYIPRLLSPLRPVPDFIGHCGSTGAVAFYVPARDIFITGTTNQQARPQIAFQTMIKIINNMP